MVSANFLYHITNYLKLILVSSSEFFHTNTFDLNETYAKIDTLYQHIKPNNQWNLTIQSNVVLWNSCIFHIWDLVHFPYLLDSNWSPNSEKRPNLFIIYTTWIWSHHPFGFWFEISKEKERWEGEGKKTRERYGRGGKPN